MKNKEEAKTIFTFGGKPEESSVTLRIFGDDLDPEEVTDLLKCQPTEAYRKGYVITTTIRPRTVKTGSWFLKIEKSERHNLEEQISELLDKVTVDLSVWKKLAERFDLSILCGTWLQGWNRDVFFGHELLKKLSERHLKITVAIYCDCDDEEVANLTAALNKKK